MLHKNTFTNYDALDKPISFAFALLKDNTDRLWFKVDYIGCYTYENNKFTHYGQNSGFENTNVYVATLNSNNEMIMTSSGEMYSFEDNRFKKIDRRNLPKGRIYFVAYDSFDNLWAGIDYVGLFKHTEGEWKEYTDNEGEHITTVDYIYNDSDSNMWIGTGNKGIYKLDKNENLINYSVDSGLIDMDVNVIMEDSQNRIWIGTQGGISIIDNNKVVDNIDTNDGLNSTKVYAFGKHEDYVLIGTADGLSIYRNNTITTLTNANGLQSNDINVLKILMHDNKAWFGTTAGITAFDIEDFLERSGLLNLYLKRIASQNDTADFNSNISHQQIKEPIQLSTSTSFVHFDFGIISYRSKSFERRYRLTGENYDSGWKTTDEDRVTLNDIFPGEFELIYSVKGFANKNTIDYTVPIIFVSPFYYEAEFWLISFLTAAAVTMLLLRLRSRKQQKDKYKTSPISVGKKSEIKKKLVELIVENESYRDSNLSLGIVAEKISVSKEHISQIVNTEFNCNFNEYVNRFRIEEAKKMLQKNGELKLNIIEVAYAVGFNNKTSFNNSFKKFVGQTPSEFKKHYHQEK